MSSGNDILVSVSGVRKKFSAHLKKSMWYGLQDLLRTALGFASSSQGLRDKEFEALHDFSFTLRRGDILGILGVNGAGKTTLLRLISGIYAPDAGEISVNGKVVSLYAATLGMHPMFTGRENVFVRAAMYGLSKEETAKRMQDIIAYAELENFIDAPLGIYSSGMRARLGFAIAVHANADVIIIDEGLAVGDVAFRAKAFKTLRDLSAHTAVLIVSHSINQIAHMANRILVMDKGIKLYETRDVQEGIDYYIRTCIQHTTPSENTSSLLEASRVYADGTPPDGMLHLQYGDALNIELDLNTAASLENCTVETELVNSHNKTVAVIHSDTAGFSLYGSGRRTLHIRIPHVELKSDKYTLHVSIRQRGDNLPLVVARHIQSFIVQAKVHTHEWVQLNAQWRLKT
jgi:lipopolysaccharide transport system ATP-binding protein